VKARANTVFSLAIAAGLAVLTFWLERAAQAPPVAPPPSGTRVPEYVVENVNATNLDKSGRPESKLTANRMVRFLDDETTEVEEPRLVQYRDEGPPFRVVAERGTVSSDGEEVRLFGKVVVSRDASKERPELRMETTYLQVFPKTEVFRTPEPVVITEGRSKLAGVGLEYDNKARRLELKARVSGTFEQEKRP
jgi:lipopolysaccharide export system protein LptC